MLDIYEFSAVFPSGTEIYSQNVQNTIRANRRTLGGSLFFDKLLGQLHVKSGYLYPPAKDGNLEELHDKIVSAEIADHYKQSLLYYLLKDCTALDDEEAAETFAKKSHLPHKYWIVIQGLWNLDHLQFEAALGYLTHPSLLPAFPEDILRVLIDHGKLANKHLPLAYYNAVRPPLTNPELQKSYITYLAHLSLIQAYFFIETQPVQDHKPLFELLIDNSLQHSRSDGSSDVVDELINLPLTAEQEAWFEEYLLKGKGKTYHAARDTVVARRLALGRYAEAIEAGQQLSGRRFNDINWDGIKDMVATSLGSRVEMNSVFNVAEI
ncbi:nuclear pore complex assembly-domain-containing protein [Phyllosticta citriasiana]|uniref:Nuclear pore complex assembly-domain-containing protein n=1 Tax=Phyllosticta citriasiana TaxID=595635 RepID=A0ABR1KY54_9PEZI